MTKGVQTMEWLDEIGYYEMQLLDWEAVYEEMDRIREREKEDRAEAAESYTLVVR